MPDVPDLQAQIEALQAQLDEQVALGATHSLAGQEAASNSACPADETLGSAVDLRCQVPVVHATPLGAAAYHAGLFQAQLTSPLLQVRENVMAATLSYRHYLQAVKDLGYGRRRVHRHQRQRTRSRSPGSRSFGPNAADLAEMAEDERDFVDSTLRDLAEIAAEDRQPNRNLDAQAQPLREALGAGKAQPLWEALAITTDGGQAR